MTRFHNPVPITVDFSTEVINPDSDGVDLIDAGQDDVSEETEQPAPDDSSPVEKVENSNKSNKSDKGQKDKLETEGIDFGDVTPEEQLYPKTDDVYLTTINYLSDEGIIEEGYEGFTEDTEPSPEVLKKLIEHNVELKQQKALEQFFETVSPLAQRILSFDLNSKGENLETFLRSIIEENNIKSLNVENEYDQEKIVRTFLSDQDFSSEEIEEKIEELKINSLLKKEAERIKPKLDQRAEAIAKEQEQSQAMLRQLETQRKQAYFDRITPILSKGKVKDIPFGQEEGEKMAALLMIDDVDVSLPEGRKVKMSLLDAEIMKHKYSSQGDPELLIMAAYLLSNPEKFYKRFAEMAHTKETNDFVKTQKYNIKTKSESVITNAKDSKPQNVKWNFKVPSHKL